MAPGDIFQADAINRAYRNAQLAPGTPGFNHRVHHLVAAHDGVYRTGLDAQRAANAPGFVNDGHGARPFNTVGWIQRKCRQAGDLCKKRDAFSAARRALVDGGQAGCNGLRIGRAVRKTAPCALRLGQCRKNAVEKRVWRVCVSGGG